MYVKTPENNSYLPLQALLYSGCTVMSVLGYVTIPSDSQLKCSVRNECYARGQSSSLYLVLLFSSLTASAHMYPRLFFV